jgi:hypothetical protein
LLAPLLGSLPQLQECYQAAFVLSFN